MKRSLDPLVAQCGFLYPSGLDKGFENPEKPIKIKYLGKFSLSEPRVFQCFWTGLSTRKCDVLFARLWKARCEPKRR